MQRKDSWRACLYCIRKPVKTKSETQKVPLSSLNVQWSQNGKCSGNCKNSKIRNVRVFGYLYRETNGLNHGPVWKTQSFLLSEIWWSSLSRTVVGKAVRQNFTGTRLGGKFPTGNVYFVHSEKGLFFSLCVGMQVAGNSHERPAAAGRTRPDTAGHGRTGCKGRKGCTGPHRAAQGRTGPHRAAQGRTGSDKHAWAYGGLYWYHGDDTRAVDRRFTGHQQSARAKVTVRLCPLWCPCVCSGFSWDWLARATLAQVQNSINRSHWYFFFIILCFSFLSFFPSFLSLFSFFLFFFLLSLSRS